MMREVGSAVFDLDETLLNWDSTTVWVLKQVNASPWRFVLAFMALPFGMPLVAVPRLRQWGASIFLWIASVGLSERTLKASFDVFAESVTSGREPRLAWLPKGVAEVHRHLSDGSRVAVVTAAAHWIAAPLIARIDSRIELAGSGMQRFWGGWVLSDHCRHARKCDALKAMGFGGRWTAAYSDSFDDLPMLARAQLAYGINVSEKSRKKFKSRCDRIRYLNW